MDFSIGTNVLRNTNGIVIAHGEELLRVELDGDTQSLTLSMDIFMLTGKKEGKLERNTWVENEENRFELQTNPESITLVDNTLKNVVIELKREESNTILIPRGKFYTSKGTISEVSQDWWRVGNKMELKRRGDGSRRGFHRIARLDSIVRAHFLPFFCCSPWCW